MISSVKLITLIWKEREREGGNSNSNLKTLFYKYCSLDSVKNLYNKLVLAKLLMSKYKITGIIYIHIGMNKRVKRYT